MSEMSKMILADTFHRGKMGTMKECIKSLACAPRACPWGFSYAKISIRKLRNNL